MDSGLVMTDEGLQADTITLTRISGVRPVELDSILTAGVIAGTSVFINW